MSSQGLTVHEANLEENRITFDGFPWALRLRYVMQHAANLSEAKTLWETTNNTVGFNHMVQYATVGDLVRLDAVLLEGGQLSRC
jgi:hypothetical protein